MAKPPMNAKGIECEVSSAAIKVPAESWFSKGHVFEPGSRSSSVVSSR